MTVLLLHSCLPAMAAEWLASDAPYEYVPARASVLHVAMRLAMAVDGACIFYALGSFRVPKHRAMHLAAAAFCALLPAVLATSAFPAFDTAHRALLYATVPPFAALIATLAPFMRPRATAPAAPAARAHGDGSAPAERAAAAEPEEDGPDSAGSEYDDDEWD